MKSVGAMGGIALTVYESDEREREKRFSNASILVQIFFVWVLALLKVWRTWTEMGLKLGE